MRTEPCSGLDDSMKGKVWKLFLEGMAPSEIAEELEITQRQAAHAVMECWFIGRTQR